MTSVRITWLWIMSRVSRCGARNYLSPRMASCIFAAGEARPGSRGETVPTTSAAIIAIDILLEPDARMLQHAEVNNARLLKAFPNGFALDAAHRPHISMLQCFVPAEDL